MHDKATDAIDDALRAYADLGLDPDRNERILDAVRLRTVPGRRARFRRPTAIAVCALVTLSVGGAAAATTGLWDPPLGDEVRGHPTTAVDDVPAEQLQLFGALRRPADDVDRDATTRAALRNLDPQLQGVRVQRIRAVHGMPDGKRYLIIPVALARGKVHDALCLYALDADGGGISCWSTRQVLDREAVLYAVRRAGPDTEGRATMIGLVPDQVRAVVSSTGSRAAVHDNVYVLTTVVRDGDLAPTWLDDHDQAIAVG